MADSKVLYSTCVAVLGFVCFVVGATAVGLPIWGYFDGGYGDDKGYFSPWKTCKTLSLNRERCGTNYSKFRPSIVVWIAGLVAAIGVAVLGVFCLLSVLQLAMLTSKEKVVMKYSVVVFFKLALGLLATLFAVAAAGLFGLQTDESNNSGFYITRGPGFYLQIMLIALNAILFVMALYDMFFSKKPGGDPTVAGAPPVGETYGNPGFKERHPQPGAISVTDASGQPYSTTTNGSTSSVHTVSTTLGSNGSTLGSATLQRSPLRSSLKKPKPTATDGLGIQNPGFSGTSPTFPRNGSIKKVRIQTHSTDV